MRVNAEERVEELGDILAAMKERLVKRGILTGANSTIPPFGLMEALKILDLPESLTVDFYEEQEIIGAAKMRQKCLGCTKTPEEATNCVKTSAFVDDKDIVHVTARVCPKGQVFLRQQKINSLTKQSGMSRRFMDRRFDTFKQLPGTTTAYNICRNFCERYTPHAKGVRLIGNYGSGKTHLAAAILNDLLQKGIPGMFVVVPDLLRQIRLGFDDKNLAKTAGELIETAKTVPVLILDDLGAEKPSEWVREYLFILLNARYEKELPTIVTTNYNTQDLMDRLGQRIISRLVEMTDSVLIDAPDYRLTRAGRAV